MWVRATNLDPLVDVSVLQLHEARRDSRDVRLLVRERDAARALQPTDTGTTFIHEQK